MQTARYALVTGASTGIGLELARVLLKRGHNLLLVSKDVGRLEKAVAQLEKEKPGEQRIRSRALDLSRDDGAGEVAQWTKDIGADVGILVNNAGVPVCGSFASTVLEEEMDMLKLNVIALTRLTKSYLPGMLEKKKGRILNVASVAGYFPGPKMAVYFATKAYVLSFTEALHHELRGTGVTATALCPGATRTRFMERGGVENSGLTEHAMMSASKVALIGYKGMMKGKRVVVPGLLNKALVGLGKHTPRGMSAAMVERLVTGHRGA